MKNLGLFLILSSTIGLFVAAGALMGSEARCVEMLQANYCEMVELYYSSSGENGWPDYKGTFDTQCNR